MNNGKKQSRQLYDLQIGLVVELRPEHMAALRASLKEYDGSVQLDGAEMVGELLLCNIGINGLPDSIRMRELKSCRRLKSLTQILLEAMGLLRSGELT